MHCLVITFRAAVSQCHGPGVMPMHVGAEWGECNRDGHCLAVRFGLVTGRDLKRNKIPLKCENNNAEVVFCLA